MNLRPLGERVVIKTEMAPTKTKAGIIVPDEMRKESRTGTIIAIGSGVPEGELSIGNIVFFAPYAHETIEQDDIVYKIMPFGSLIAVHEKGRD